MAPLRWLGSFVRVVRESARAVAAVDTLSRRDMVMFALLILPAPFLEVAGISMLLPLVDLIEHNGNIQSVLAKGGVWRYIGRAADFVHLPLNTLSLSLVIAALVGLRQGLQFQRMRLIARRAEDMVAKIRDDLSQAVLMADATTLRKLGIGRTADIGMQQISRCRNVLSRLVELSNFMWTCVVYAVALLVVSPEMTLLGGAAFAAGGIATGRLVRKVRAISKQTVVENGHYGAWYLQVLTSWRVIKLYNAEEREQEEARRRSKLIADLNFHQNELAAKAPRQVTVGAVVIALVILNVAATSEALRAGIIMIFILMLVRVLPMLLSFMQIMQGLVAQQASMTLVLQRTRQLRQAAERDGGSRALGGLATGITLDGVRYQYAGAARPALDGVSLFFPAEKVTVVGGPSGAGKSTLVDLLPRLVSPTEGTIAFDGVPVEEFTLTSLRQAIGFLDQGPCLMSDTVEGNLRYGRPDASDEDLREACRIACALDFVEALPSGFATRLGEDSQGLSGGQLQRLALARALVARRPILILDEPTSAVDGESEQSILAALRTAADKLGMTVIMITHRPFPTWFADQHIILQNGKLHSCRTIDRGAA